MKYLVILLVVLVAVWVWRNNRRVERQDREQQDRPAPPQPLASPQDMVRCPVCAVHLPRTDALPGPDGQLYCCQEHRQQAAN